jgi:hypothetical protein
MKRLSLLLAILLFLFLVVTNTRADITNGLVGYWPFDGNTNDVSGMGNNGTVTGSVTYTQDRFGTPNSAVHFPGMSAYISTSTNSIPFGSQPRTMVAWVRINQKTGPGRIGLTLINYGNQGWGVDYYLSFDKADEHCYVPYQWYYPSGSFTLTVGTWGAPNNVCAGPDLVNFPTTGYPFGTWHHVASTYDGNIHKIYFDCQLKNSGSVATNTQSGGLPLYIGGIGADPANGDLTLNGDMDDVRIYNRALSDSDIKEFCGPITVTIDIKPGSDIKSINLGSAGVVPVAILSSSTFDATQVNPATVSLAGAKVKLIGKGDKYSCSAQDVNGDGLFDLLCHVVTAQFMIEPGDSIAVLEANTFDGQAIRGQNSIRIVP